MDKENYKESTHNGVSSRLAKGQKNESGLTSVARAFRAVTAIAVFGIPMVAGVATFLGLGVYKAYKRFTSRS
jgi:hypothetical protein